MLVRQRNDLAHVGCGIRLLIDKPPLEQHVEFGVGHAGALATVIIAQFDLIPELALPGRMIISDINRTSGRPISSLASSTTLGIGISQRKMQEVIGAQQVFLARRRDRRGQDAGAAIDVSAPSSRQTRSESSTVVMPDVASWPS